MSKIDKCYIYTKEYTCDVTHDSIQDILMFQFGDGELVDKDGDSYFVYCEFDLLAKNEIIQLWYSDYVATIYSTIKGDKVTELHLTQDDINEILREFHRILNLFKEEK